MTLLAPICSCTHRFDDHDGFVRGPIFREWCNGAGEKEVPEPMYEGDPSVAKHPICECREYDGPDPYELSDTLSEGC